MAGVAANMANANPSATNYSSSCALKPLIGLPFHQKTADELRSSTLMGACQERLGVTPGESGGYESCLEDGSIRCLSEKRKQAALRIS